MIFQIPAVGYCNAKVHSIHKDILLFLPNKTVLIVLKIQKFTHENIGQFRTLKS